MPEQEEGYRRSVAHVTPSRFGWRISVATGISMPTGWMFAFTRQSAERKARRIVRRLNAEERRRKDLSFVVGENETWPA